MKILRRTLPERIIRRLTRHPVLVVSSVSLSVKLGKDAYALRTGDIDGSEFRRRTGGHLGTLSGGMAGAAAGAAAGSMLPGFGTVLGALAGGMVGEMAGGKLGREAVDRVETIVRQRAAASEPPPPPGTPRRHL